AAAGLASRHRAYGRRRPAPPGPRLTDRRGRPIGGPAAKRSFAVSVAGACPSVAAVRLGRRSRPGRAADRYPAPRRSWRRLPKTSPPNRADRMHIFGETPRMVREKCSWGKEIRGLTTEAQRTQRKPKSK